MTPIDLSTSLVGELFPLITDGAQAGRLGLFRLGFGEFLYLPYDEVHYRERNYLCTTATNAQVDFKWRITPLLNGKVVITCTHPTSGHTYIVYCRQADSLIDVVQINYPAYYEQVSPEYEMEMEYLEGSPLFFRFKTPHNQYVARHNFVRYDDRQLGYFQVFDRFDETMITNPQAQIQSCWYLQLNAALTHPNAFNGFKTIKPLTALTKKLGFNINEAYLKNLTHL